MKKSLTLIAAVVMIAGAQATSQESVSLKRIFTNGSKDTYKVTTKVVNNMDLSAVGQGNMEINVDMSQTSEYAYSEVKEDGTAKVNFAYRDLEIKVDGPMADMMSQGPELPKEIKGTAKIDALGRMTEVKIESAQQNMAQMMMGGSQNMDLMTQFAYPKDAVKVGEEFKVEMPKLPMFKEVKMTGTVIGAVKFDDIDAWKIEYKGTMVMDMDMSEMMKDAPQDAGTQMPAMKVEGNTKSTSTFIVAKDNGRVLSMDTNSTTDGKIKLIDMGFEMPMTTDMAFKMVIKK